MSFLFAQVGDVGVALVIALVDQDGDPINVSGATALTIKLGYPDRTTTADKTAQLYTDGADGKIQYVTAANDLNQSGLYEIQGHITLSGAPVSSRVGYLKVLQNVDDS